MSEELTFARKLALVLPVALVNISAYVLLNQFPLSTPYELPASAIDRAVPFMVWTTLPYFLLLAADMILPFLIDNRERFVDMVRAYGVAIVLNMLTWSTFPTTVPRPETPLGDDVATQLYLTMMSWDAPVNCFPSGHITIPAVLVWAVGRERPSWRLPLWVWFAFSSLTILTTKQHYFVDLLGGLGTAAVGVAASMWWRRRASA